MITVGRHESIAAIPRGEWDAIAASHSFFASWGWLRYLEGAPGAAAGYLTVADGELRAGWPVTTVTHPVNERYDLDVLFPGLAGGAPVLAAPYVVAGACRGYRATAMSRKPADMTALLAATIGECRGTGGLAVLYLDTGGAASVAAALHELGRPSTPLLTDAEAVIGVHGRSLAGHLAASHGRLRRRMRREMALFESSGLRVVRRPLRACAGALAPLHHELLQRHGRDWDLARTERSLRRLAAAAPAEPLLLLAVDETDEPVGFSLSYPWGDTLYVRVTGYRYARLRDSCEYFVLTCYEPIQRAALSGLANVHLGLESLHAKLIRGAELSPLWSVIVPPGHDLPDGTVRALNRARAAAFREHYAAHRTAFTQSSWQAWQ